MSVFSRLQSVPPHSKAVAQALFVTFLWSTSWVLIKIGLEEIPALTFAGLRYALATVVLVPIVIHRLTRETHTTALPASRSMWLRIVLLGVVLYAVTQGAQFLALERLPAQTTSLILSFSPVLVALFAVVLLSERMVQLQWAGVAGYLAGAWLFLGIPHGEIAGLVIAIAGLIGNAGAAVAGRAVNRRRDVDPLVVTVVSMGTGAIILLGAGLATQGWPSITVSGWLIITWLAVVNTAFAFVLWNLTMRTLPAVESSVINNTMLVQIAILAWIFLGEALTLRQMAGLLLAIGGVLVVQLRPGSSRPRA